MPALTSVRVFEGSVGLCVRHPIALDRTNSSSSSRLGRGWRPGVLLFDSVQDELVAVVTVRSNGKMGML